MTDRKLIIPAELKVCATCCYWSGDRSVDDEVRVVVVCESCQGECLVRGVSTPSLRSVRANSECLWDDLHFETPPPEEDQADESLGAP